MLCSRSSPTFFRKNWVTTTHLIDVHVGLVELFRHGQNGTVGVYADYDAFGAALLYLVADARHGAAGAGAYHHHVDVVIQGPQDLFRRAVIVRQGVAHVVVLFEGFLLHVTSHAS